MDSMHLHLEDEILVIFWCSYLGQVLAEHIFCHVPCPHFDYRGKITYIAICLRRMMAAIIDPSMIDDRCAFLYNFFSCR